MAGIYESILGLLSSPNQGGLLADTGGGGGVGSATSNFVVFPGNEGLLSILERNGQPLK